MGENIEFYFYKDVREFLKSLDTKVKAKISFNIEKVKNEERDNEIFKKIGDFWELRTKYNGICYRLISFWDKEEKRLVVVTHGFVKKTNKLPQKEIDKAEMIKNIYYSQKENRDGK